MNTYENNYSYVYSVSLCTCNHSGLYLSRHPVGVTVATSVAAMTTSLLVHMAEGLGLM